MAAAKNLYVDNIEVRYISMHTLHRLQASATNPCLKNPSQSTLVRSLHAASSFLVFFCNGGVQCCHLQTPDVRNVLSSIFLTPANVFCRVRISSSQHSRCACVNQLLQAPPTHLTPLSPSGHPQPESTQPPETEPRHPKASEQAAKGIDRLGMAGWCRRASGAT